MTGAAGLVGGEVCARLVARGHRVTALVHRNPEVRANDGGLVPVAGVLKGDVSQPRFGWGETQFAEAAETHDLLVHCAATVRFDLDEEDYRVASHAQANLDHAPEDFSIVLGANEIALQNVHRSIAEAIGMPLPETRRA